jgi:hypothetical protein
VTANNAKSAAIETAILTAFFTHHIEPRAQGGPDIPDNVTTLCDLCHAVVTRRWHKPWFGRAAVTNRGALDEARQEYLEFLALDPLTRRKRQEQVWALCGIVRAAPKRSGPLR